MATVIYGLAGEGRGHAMRAKTVIEHLRAQGHRIIIYTFGQALEVLQPLYDGTEVEVNEIPGLRWGYVRGKVSFWKTLIQAFPLLAQIPFWAVRISRRIKAERTDLVLSDFEPMTMHAAKLAGAPLWSLDHQRFLLYCDLGRLPWFEAFRVWCMKTAIRIVHGFPDRVLISGFYLPKLKKPSARVERVGILMRQAVLQAKPTTGEHLLVYMRRECPDSFLNILAQCGREVRLYGLGKRPDLGGIVFQETEPDRFIDDLASCRGLICTAGNQLIGEAMYLSKPVLALPEGSNSEQRMNARLLEMSGAGMVVDFDHVRATDVSRFLQNAELMGRRINPQSVAANSRVLGLIDRQLGSGVEELSTAMEKKRKLVG